jgi:hypothetical protein
MKQQQDGGKIPAARVFRGTGYLHRGSPAVFIEEFLFLLRCFINFPSSLQFAKFVAMIVILAAAAFASADALGESIQKRVGLKEEPQNCYSKPNCTNFCHSRKLVALQSHSYMNCASEYGQFRMGYGSLIYLVVNRAMHPQWEFTGAGICRKLLLISYGSHRKNRVCS